MREVLKKQPDLKQTGFASQVFWLLFLKFLDDAEIILEKVHEGDAQKWQNILDKDIQWRSWAKREWQGNEMIEFINKILFPYLKAPLEGHTKERKKVADIFQKIGNNKISSIPVLLELIGLIKEIKVEHYHLENKDVMESIYNQILGKDKLIGTECQQGLADLKPIIKEMNHIINFVYKMIRIEYQRLFYGGTS